MWSFLDSLEKTKALVFWLVLVAGGSGFIAGVTGLLAILAGFRVERLQKDIDEKREATQVAKDTATASREATAEAKQVRAEKEVARLANEQQPRTIDPEKRTRALEILRAVPSAIELQVVAQDTEANDFAVALRELLTEAGWSPGPISAFVTPDMIRGLVLVVKDLSHAPIPAGALQQAATALGFAAPGEANPSFSESKIMLTIGHKP